MVAAAGSWPCTGLGSWPQGLTDSVVGFYWTAFLLEVCELTATKTASITLIGRVFDAVTDPLVGYWLTRTDTRWGKLRPWMSLAILPCAAFYIGMWLKPAGMEGDDPALFAYIVGVYLLYQFSTTCYYVPYTALVVHLSNDPGQRNLGECWHASHSRARGGGGTAPQKAVVPDQSLWHRCHRRRPRSRCCCCCRWC